MSSGSGGRNLAQTQSHSFVLHMCSIFDHCSSKNAKDLLVPAFKMWTCSAFLWFIWLKTNLCFFGLLVGQKQIFEIWLWETVMSIFHLRNANSSREKIYCNCFFSKHHSLVLQLQTNVIHRMAWVDMDRRWRAPVQTWRKPEKKFRK